jgi:transposase
VGTRCQRFARPVAADEDTVRAVIHLFNEIGLDCLDPHWAGGRPRRISPKDEAFLVQTAQTRPDNAPVHVICDNLSVNTTPKIRRWAARNGVHLCLTPT